MKRREDCLLIMLYEAWSEETWHAGFISPDANMVTDFRAWLATEYREQMAAPLEDYETAMLVEFRRQEAAATEVGAVTMGGTEG